MKPLIFFGLQLKRMSKKKHLLFILGAFLIGMLLFSYSLSSREDTRIPIALCLETEDELAVTLYQKLLTSDDSVFRFIEADSFDDLTRMIENGSAECGYLLRKPLLYELEKKHINNLIRVYVSENTTCKGVLNEYVYSQLFEEYALQLLNTTLKKDDRLPFTEADAIEFNLPTVTDAVIEKQYRSYFDGKETFHFEIYTVSVKDDAAVTVSEDTVDSTLAPVFHGLTSLFLLLGGFLALLTVKKDQTNGLYDKLHGVERLNASVLTMTASLLPFFGVALLTLVVIPSQSPLQTELLPLIVYFPILVVFFLVLGRILPNTTVLCGAFPMLLMISVLFTPVITDLSTIFPWMRLVRLGLPTYYYLWFF